MQHVLDVERAAHIHDAEREDQQEREDESELDQSRSARRALRTRHRGREPVVLSLLHTRTHRATKAPMKTAQAKGNRSPLVTGGGAPRTPCETTQDPSIAALHNERLRTPRRTATINAITPPAIS